MANNPQFYIVPFVDTSTGLVKREWYTTLDRIINAATTGDFSGLQNDLSALESTVSGLAGSIASLQSRVSSAGSALIDFGPFPGTSNTSLSVSGQPRIGSTSILNAWVMPASTTDHTSDEHQFETLRVTAGAIIPGSGFTIYGINTGNQDTRLYGKWSVGWQYQG